MVTNTSGSANIFVVSVREAIARCQYCGQTASFPVDITGHVTKCQNCGQEFVLEAYTEEVSPPTLNMPPAQSGSNFKVVAFMANVQEGQSPDVAGKQLEKVINDHEAHGWEYVRVENVTMKINPGCLSFMSGPTYSTYDYVVFKQRK